MLRGASILGVLAARHEHRVVEVQHDVRMRLAAGAAGAASSRERAGSSTPSRRRRSAPTSRRPGIASRAVDHVGARVDRVAGEGGVGVGCRRGWRRWRTRSPGRRRTGRGRPRSRGRRRPGACRTGGRAPQKRVEVHARGVLVEARGEHVVRLPRASCRRDGRCVSPGRVVVPQARAAGRRASQWPRRAGTRAPRARSAATSFGRSGTTARGRGRGRVALVRPSPSAPTRAPRGRPG